MGMFSWLSRSSKVKKTGSLTSFIYFPQSYSFIDEWVDRKMKESRVSNDMTPEMMFAGFIYLLSFFGTSKKPSKATEGVEPFVITHFARDYALFELACYMYFRIDWWLFSVRSDLREKIIRVFQREFVTLFSKALQMDNTADLFKQRVNKYGELARRDAAEEYHPYLSQLIYGTKDNQKPELYGLESGPPLILDICAMTGLRLEVANWEIAYLPAIVESIKKTSKRVKSFE